MRHAATALLIALWAPWAAHANVCSLELVGTWKAAVAEPRLLSFSANGWANVLGGSSEQQPNELDILAQVQYEIVSRRWPPRVAFQARRGNDVFPSGNSSWEITAYTDESFSARSARGDDVEPSSWTRVQTHRYFLTLAARGETTLFVIWTTLDGRSTQREALGTTPQGKNAHFGTVPQQIVQAFATQSERTDDAMMRVELSEAEYRRTHQVFVAWNTLVRRDVLAREDPLRQALLLLDATLQNINRCGMKVRAVGALAPETTSLSPLDLIRSIRKVNARVHVSDKAFPFRWQPPPAI